MILYLCFEGASPLPLMGVILSLYAFVKDYYRLNNANYQLSGCPRQLISSGKMKPQSGITKCGFTIVVHILKQASQLPQVLPFDPQVIGQSIQGKQGRLVLSFDDIVDGPRAEAGIYR